MEQELAVTMFGNPAICLNGRPLGFPYRQAEAILYYLFINKSANKYMLADIIWEDKYTEEKTNSNLRNALYVIRKGLGKDFILNENNGIIRINPQYPVKLDTEQFLKDKNKLDLYQGDFLDGFFLKNNTAFNDWVENTRQIYKSHYLQKLHDSITDHYASGNYSICESLCRKQIQINEFDETAYKYLMQIYLGKKEYTEALHIYNQLEMLLEQELFESPGKDIQELADSIEKSRNEEVSRILNKRRETKSAPRPAHIFYGRTGELKKLQDSLAASQSGKHVRHIVITGEAGIGKTELVSQILLHPDFFPWFLPLSARCYYAEEKYILKPWQKPVHELLQYMEEHALTAKNTALIQSIEALFPFSLESCTSSLDVDDISTLDYKSIQSVFVHALIRLASVQPLLLFFDDLQWADEVSLSLIRDIMTSLRNYNEQNILFLFTVRSDSEGTARRFLEDMDSLRLLETIPLDRFSYEDTIRLASCLLPGYSFTDAMKEHLFHETEGNVLFIKEAVNTIKYNGSPADITPNMRNIIKQRIAPIPSEYRQILNLVSVFFDGASYDCLSVLSRKEDYELVEILEYLLNQNLLKEEANQEDTFFYFTHQKIMEYVYDEMSWTKKRILHNKAGHYYEKQLRGNTSDMALYPKLIYHFDRGANQQKYLKYAVKYLYNYLNVTHEFFPIIEKNLTLFSLDMHEETRERLSSDLGSIEKLLHVVENKVNTSPSDFLLKDSSEDEELEILSDYLHMIGRHYIRICNYEKGLRYILQLKDMNQKHPSSFQTEKLLQANRQLICVYINRCEPKKMDEVVKDSLRILKSTSFTDETAIWKRLQGLGDIMSGQLSLGIRHLQEAIDIFAVSPEKDKHLYNLAAAYSWIGEACRHSFRYKKALEYYDKALHIANSNFLVSGIAVFYAYAGMAAYDSGDKALAEKYLTASISHYEKGNLMWGRSLPYSYYALLLIEEGKWNTALCCLKTALSYAKKLESPYEKGIIYRIYAQIKSGVFSAHTPENTSPVKLPRNARYYYETARSLIDSTFSPVDTKYLDELQKKMEFI